MATNNPKIAELRAASCKRVEKCSLRDLDILGQVLDLLEYARRMKARSQVCAPDEMMDNRWFLLYGALICHDEDAPKAIDFLRVLRRIRAEKEMGKRNQTACAGTTQNT